MKILGDTLNWELHANKLRLKAENGLVELALINDSTARISYSAGSEIAKTKTYAVPEEPEFIHFNAAVQEGKLLIITSAMRIIIQLRPLRFRFESPDGTLLSEDDEGLGIISDGPETTCYKKLQPAERFMGLGEKTGPLNKAGKQYRNWNTDAYSYGPETDPLYVSCPFYLGMANEKFYGIFLNNTYETVFNFGAANDRFSFFQAKGGAFEYYFFAGPGPREILRDYTALTGRMAMPPMWSLGFQQCRYSYYPDLQVLRLAQTFREKKIPADVIYFDIHYMQDYKVFTWQEEKFSDPKTLIDKLRELNFRVVVILDPGVKVEDDYEVYENGMAEDVFVKYPDGAPYRGAAWPGWCHFPDFTEGRVRKWWGGQMKKLIDTGLSGYWTDMNEPAVWGHHTPNILQFGMDGEPVDHKAARNVYGIEMAKATKEGAMEAKPHERPFVLTRAAFSGAQRDAAVWTGDNYANDEHLMLGCRMLSGMGLSGFGFTGNDIGGFVGDASPALYRRWIALSVFQPLMRAHSMINSRDAEPWSFGEEGLEVARNFINLRYKLLPHIYSLFYECTQNGMPPLRSLVFDYAQEWKIFTNTFQNQFLLGEHLLVCPVSSETTICKVYLPAGTWYNFYNDMKLEGGREHLVELERDTIPVYIKAGGIVPMQHLIQHTDENPDPELQLHLYMGSEGQYQFYEDEGKVEGANKHLIRNISLNKNSLTISEKIGSYVGKFSRARIYLHGFSYNEVIYREKSLKINRDNFQFIDPVSNFDPYEDYDNKHQIIDNLAYINLDLSAEEMHITLR